MSQNLLGSFFGTTPNGDTTKLARGFAGKGSPMRPSATSIGSFSETTSECCIADRKFRDLGGASANAQGMQNPSEKPSPNTHAASLSGYLCRKGCIFSTLTGVVPFVTRLPRTPFSLLKTTGHWVGASASRALMLVLAGPLKFASTLPARSLLFSDRLSRGISSTGPSLKKLVQSLRQCHESHPQTNVLVIPPQGRAYSPPLPELLVVSQPGSAPVESISFSHSI